MRIEMGNPKNEFTLGRRILRFFAGLACLAVAFLLWKLCEWTYEEYVAVGIGLDPRALIGIAAIGFFVVGAICITTSLLPRAKKKRHQRRGKARLSTSPEEMRSFVAIELPEQVKDGLASLSGELKRAEHSFVKWVGPEGVHLILKFLGNIPAIQVTEISDTIATATRGVPPFYLEVASLGAFPNLEQPRVLWVGIRGEVATLLQLQQNIDSGLTALGFAQEERPFAPYLTLARLRQTASPAERKAFGELTASASFDTGYPFDVKAVSLMRSQLTPAGAIYTRLSIVELQG